jgi:hypothetical protein
MERVSGISALKRMVKRSSFDGDGRYERKESKEIVQKKH